MYKNALRQNVTFNSTRVGGHISLQSLFDLPLEHPSKACLDEIATAVHMELQATKGKTVSFVSAKSADTSLLELKLDILKDIIKDKIVERDAKQNAKAISVQREAILEEIHKRQKDFTGKTDEELAASLAALQNG